MYNELRTIGREKVSSGEHKVEVKIEFQSERASVPCISRNPQFPTGRPDAFSSTIVLGSKYLPILWRHSPYIHPNLMRNKVPTLTEYLCQYQHQIVPCPI